MSGKIQHQSQGPAPDPLIIAPAPETYGRGAMGTCQRCGKYEMLARPFDKDFPYCVKCYHEMIRTGEMQDDS